MLPIYKWLPATVLIEEDWSNSFFMEYTIRLMCLIYCLISVEIRLWKRASRLQNYTLSMYLGCDLYSTFLLYYSSNRRNCRFSNIIIWFIVSYQLILFIHFNLIISMHFFGTTIMWWWVFCTNPYLFNFVHLKFNIWWLTKFLL